MDNLVVKKIAFSSLPLFTSVLSDIIGRIQTTMINTTQSEYQS